MTKNFLVKFLFVLLVLIQENCYAQFSQIDADKLIIRFDEFKKTNTTLLKIKSYSVESRKGFWGKIPDYTLNANFYNAGSSDSNITCSFSLTISDVYQPLDSIVYLKINDSIYKLYIHTITKNISTNVEASTTGVGTEKRVTDISTSLSIVYTGKIYLPHYVYKQIKPTSKFIVRMYLDYETVTFSFLPPEINLLYQFISEKY